MKKRNRLLVFTLAMLAPSIGAVLIAAAGIFHFQKMLETITRSYVENLAEGVANRIKTSWDFKDVGSSLTYYSQRFRVFAGISSLPSLIAVLDSKGRFVYGADTAHAVLSQIGSNYPIASAWEMHDEAGNKYTVAIFPTLSTHYYVLAAVPWKMLPGYAVRLGYLWPLIVGTVGVSGLLAVWLMWRRVILPLQEFEAEVSELRWGEDIPGYGSATTVYELQKLRIAFVGLAREAIQRTLLTKSYVNDLVRVQEEERSRLSREIHDGVLQDVTALIQRMRLARMEVNDCDEVRRQLGVAEDIAHSAVREMRALCDMLNPPWLELGLKQAITELTDRQSVQYGVKISVSMPEELELPEEVVLALFRVIQESVSNSVRHGRAQKIRVSVERNASGCLMEIIDDGVGFSRSETMMELRSQGHRGLANMHERMALIGGTFKVSAKKGEGTIVSCWVPCEEGKAHPNGTEQG